MDALRKELRDVLSEVAEHWFDIAQLEDTVELQH